MFWYESDIRYTPQQRSAEREQIAADREHIVKNIGQLEPGVLQRLGGRSKEDMALFMAYLKTGGRKGLFDDKLALRAVKIAFHINKNGIRKMFQQGVPGGNEAAINNEIYKAIAQKEVCSTRLTGLRLHHQLTMLQIAGYKDLAKKLAYSD